MGLGAMDHRRQRPVPGVRGAVAWLNQPCPRRGRFSKQIEKKVSRFYFELKLSKVVFFAMLI